MSSLTPGGRNKVKNLICFPISFNKLNISLTNSGSSDSNFSSVSNGHFRKFSITFFSGYIRDIFFAFGQNLINSCKLRKLVLLS